MDILRAEIERKRKAAEAQKSVAATHTTDATAATPTDAPKWKRRADIERDRLQQIRLQEELDRQRKEELAKKRQEEEERKYVKPETKIVLPSNATEQAPDINASPRSKESSLANPILPESEVKRRLRAMKEPITLFGETRLMRENRLRQLELKLEHQGDVDAGQHNEYALALQEAEDTEGKKLDVKATNGPEDDYDALLADESKLTAKEDLIAAFLKRIFKDWEAELDRRPDEVKRTAQGKEQLASMKQSQMWMKTFFLLLQKRELSSDILPHVWQIVELMKSKEYIMASRIYLTLAIGNAPWPMGVTMVGIHERSAREKIFSHSIAHVLNDETQRKYIQALKRLMTTYERLNP